MVDQPTIMTASHRQMLAFWYGLLSDMDVDRLANNMIRKFKMDKNAAWILATRFINERRDS
jgi:hypothetical protein